MNRRDIKNKNKIADTDTGTDNELQPLQGFSEGFNTNGLNNKFGELSNRAAINYPYDLEQWHTAENSVGFNMNMQYFFSSFNFHFVMSRFPLAFYKLRHVPFSMITSLIITHGTIDTVFHARTCARRGI